MQGVKSLQWRYVEVAAVGELLLTPCKKRCDDEEELQLLNQIESLFLLKELPSSPECWPCGAESSHLLCKDEAQQKAVLSCLYITE